MDPKRNMWHSSANKQGRSGSCCSVLSDEALTCEKASTRPTNMPQCVWKRPRYRSRRVGVFRGGCEQLRSEHFARSCHFCSSLIQRVEQQTQTFLPTLLSAAFTAHKLFFPQRESPSLPRERPTSHGQLMPGSKSQFTRWTSLLFRSVCRARHLDNEISLHLVITPSGQAESKQSALSRHPR